MYEVSGKLLVSSCHPSVLQATTSVFAPGLFTEMLTNRRNWNRSCEFFQTGSRSAMAGPQCSYRNSAAESAKTDGGGNTNLAGKAEGNKRRLLG